MKEKIPLDSPKNMEETRKEHVIKKTREIIEFLEDITPHYSLCYNDVLLFMKLHNDFKELDLINSADGQRFSDLLIRNLEAKNRIQVSDPEEILGEKLKTLENNYKLKNMHYRQTSPYTCSIAAYMMAVNVFKRDFKPTKEKEKELYDKLLRPNTEIIQLCDLVEDALKNNLHVKVFSQFNYKDKKFDNAFAETLRLNYLKVIDECKKNEHFQEYTGIELTPALLRDRLMSGEPIIINGTTESGEVHARLITGYDKENFIVSDPLLYQKQGYSFEDIQKLNSPPLGVWFFTLSNKGVNFYSNQQDPQQES
jgi:hypothetical protein